jgi:hypothetical protein
MREEAALCNALEEVWRWSGTGQPTGSLLICTNVAEKQHCYNAARSAALSGGGPPNRLVRSTHSGSTQLNTTQLNSTQRNSTQLNSTQLNSTQLNSTQASTQPLLPLCRSVNHHIVHAFKWAGCHASGAPAPASNTPDSAFLSAFQLTG